MNPEAPVKTWDRGSCRANRARPLRGIRQRPHLGDSKDHPGISATVNHRGSWLRWPLLQRRTEGKGPDAGESDGLQVGGPSGAWDPFTNLLAMPFCSFF